MQVLEASFTGTGATGSFTVQQQGRVQFTFAGIDGGEYTLQRNAGAGWADWNDKKCDSRLVITGDGIAEVMTSTGEAQYRFNAADEAGTVEITVGGFWVVID